MDLRRYELATLAAARRLRSSWAGRSPTPDVRSTGSALALPQKELPGVVLTERSRNRRHAMREVQHRVAVEPRAVVVPERHALVRAPAVGCEQVRGGEDR